MSEYTKQAEDFLTLHNLEFRAVLIGDDCPPFCEDAAKGIDMDKVNVYPRTIHIHGKHYRCTISGKDRGYISIDFWNSYADCEENFFAFDTHGRASLCFGRENVYWDKYRIGCKYPGGPRIKKPITPSPYDLLASLTKNDPGTLADFCGDYGYNEDSIKGGQVYIAVCREYQKVRDFFTETELEQLQEIQ